MNEEIKAEWVKRLRSGEIPQARGRLGYRDGSRCCLGVLCDVMVDRGVISPPTTSRSGYLSYSTSQSVLPIGVQNAASLNSEVPSVCTESGHEFELADLNDSGAPFSQIADLIDRYL